MKKPVISTPKPVTWATMSAAAGALKVPVSVLRDLKKRGAAGFDPSGRVKALDLLRWMVTKGKDLEPKLSLEEARAILATAKAEEVTRNAAISRRELAPVSEQRQSIMMLAHFTRMVNNEAARQVAYQFPDPFCHDLASALESAFARQSENILALAKGTGAVGGWALDALRDGFLVSDADFASDLAAWKEFMALGTALTLTKALEAIIAERKGKEEQTKAWLADLEAARKESRSPRAPGTKSPQENPPKSPTP